MSTLPEYQVENIEAAIIMALCFVVLVLLYRGRRK